MKANCEEEFHLLCEKICNFGETLDIPVSVPKIVARQTHRSNIPSDTSEGHYKRKIFIPFLDHVLVDIERDLLLLTSNKLSYLALYRQLLLLVSNSESNAIGQIYASYLPGSPIPSIEEKMGKYTRRSQAAIFITTCIASM